MRTRDRLLTITLIAAALAFAAPATTAFADTPPTYGQHVRDCAQTMGGFTGAHNPGMHRGASGWDGSPCQ
jgi:hypothetical protein